MRKTAADFQLSETAYLVPLDPEAEEPLYGLRWWTPEEVS
jgi:predicted PhzF superfamily epimerase YddE/YHI9